MNLFKYIFETLEDSYDAIVSSAGVIAEVIEDLTEFNWIKSLLIIVLFSGSADLMCQSEYSLDDIIRIARGESLSAKTADYDKSTASFNYTLFEANYKPNVELYGRVPGFSRRFQETTQPDGTIAFQPVSLNNSNVGVSLNQVVAKTGGTFFAQSDLQRFDDFDKDFNIYNGLPIRVGYEQPLFRFNPHKWDRKIEPIRLTEANQKYAEDIELMSLETTARFFDVLLAYENLNIAQTNQANTDTLYQIAKERYTLGKISQQDLLQLQLNLANAGKDATSASQQVQNSLFNLKSFISLNDSEDIRLSMPETLPALQVDPSLAVSEALANRADSKRFIREFMEAERAYDEAVQESGFNASLSLSAGFSNSSSILSEVYTDAKQAQAIQMTFAMPILDGRRNKTRIAQTKMDMQFAESRIAQEKIDFENQVRLAVRAFNQIQKELEQAKLSNEIAQRRYEISNERYYLSDISITDLTIALQEKDTARREYIRTLRNYWRSYYSLRALTLYDFIENKKITQ